MRKLVGAAAIMAAALMPNLQGQVAIRSIPQVKQIICTYPDSVKADINMYSSHIEGMLLPRFNAKYGERGAIFINDNSIKSPENDALANYTDFQNHGGQFSSRRPRGMCEDGSNRFNEFLNRMDTLSSFNEIQFRVDEPHAEYGYKLVYFRRAGFRASAPGRRLSVGAYQINPIQQNVNDMIDGVYLKPFNEDFDSWLSFGGRRQAVRMTPGTYHGNTGPRLPGVTDVENNKIAGQMLVITEER